MRTAPKTSNNITTQIRLVKYVAVTTNKGK